MIRAVCSTLSPLLDLSSITDTLLELNIPVVWINRLRKQDPHEEGPVYNTASELHMKRDQCTIQLLSYKNIELQTETCVAECNKSARESDKIHNY
jgi:hypothetical protein